MFRLMRKCSPLIYILPSLKGFAHWFKKQAQEELEHAMKLNSRGIEVKLSAITTPSFAGKTAFVALEASLAHEKHITKKITALFDLAREKKDYASFLLLQWFIDEQVEEEENVTTLIASLKNAGESKTTILFLDGQMGKRT
jgi:ferritin